MKPEFTPVEPVSPSAPWQGGKVEGQNFGVTANRPARFFLPVGELFGVFFKSAILGPSCCALLSGAVGAMASPAEENYLWAGVLPCLWPSNSLHSGHSSRAGEQRGVWVWMKLFAF